MSFTDFNLHKDFISSIEDAGYQSPTPLQSQLIPLVEQQKSALILSQSASGKTGAFLIPAINYILENPAPEKRGARVLVLTSRRDRVSQINYTIKRLSNNHNIRFGFIVSGRPYQTQMRLMRRPLDIMIATPGRLNDLMENNKADFSQLEMLIIDDLSSIYQKNLHGLVTSIINQADENIPSLVFTSNDDKVVSFAKETFPKALVINIADEVQDRTDTHGQNSPHKTSNMQTINNTGGKHNNSHKSQPAVDPKKLMPQIVHVADDYTHKIALMDHLLDEFAGESTIIYASTAKVAKILQENLTNHGHGSELIHDLSGDELATEDIDTLIVCDQDNPENIKNYLDSGKDRDKHIIHFDLPYKTANFIKRLGNHNFERDSAAILIVDGRNFSELKQIEKTIGATLQQATVPGLEPLLPFVNKSKQHSHKPKNNAKNSRKQPQKTSNNKNRKNNNSNDENKSKRQRKGPFGRLNGGAHRKQTDKPKKDAHSKARNSKAGNTKAGKSDVRNNNQNKGQNQNRTTRNKQPNRKKRQQVGLSTRGTNAPTHDRSWQSDFAEPKERKTPNKRVVIRYKDKKRNLLPENANEDS